MVRRALVAVLLVRVSAEVDWLDRANGVARTLLPEFPEAATLGLFDAATALWRTTADSGDQLGWQNGYTLKTLSTFAVCARRADRFLETADAAEAAVRRTFDALAPRAGRAVRVRRQRGSKTTGSEERLPRHVCRTGVCERCRRFEERPRKYASPTDRRVRT